MRVILRLQAVLLCVLCVGFGCPAHADTGYGCATEGGGNNDDCTTLSPLPWRYTACDDAGTTAARQADWCFAFGGTGDATRCSADEHFSDANIAPVSTNFEHIVHGCETPSMSDTGWGQTVDSLNCQVGGPTLDGGLLIEDHRLLTFTGHEAASACVKPFSERVFAARYRDLTCPAGYQRIKIDADHDFCLRTPSCPCHIVSNPTRVSDGQKIYWETDLAPVGGGLLQYKRVYRSGGRLQPWQAAAGASEEFWESNFDSRLFVLDPTRNVVPYLVSAPEGTVRYFDANGSEYLHYGRAAERLSMQRNASGQITGYVRTLSDDSAETFAPDGRLMRYDDTQGHALTLAYDAAARLSSVTDERGRTLRFEYNGAGQRTAVVSPDGTRIAYAYGANANLQSVTYADGAVRSYRYENTAFPHALTGIGDENGADYAAYVYDSAGRVQDTRHAPALAGGAIEHFHFSYDTNTTTITEPLGQAVTYTFALAGGVKNLASLSGPCGGCGEPFAAVQYDSAGYFSRATDFNGNSTTYVYDDLRGLETSRTEALGTSAQRTVTTVPDAQLRKPALRTVSNTSGDETRSAWQYNARGQTIAQCQIDPNELVGAAYTCSRDSAPPAGAAVRRWTYRYCESDDIAAGTCPLPGLLVSSDGPRTDVADVTSYAYYDTTDASGCGVPAGQCHARGDLKSVTNALGQVTSYIAYDALGHAVRIKDANGTTIDVAYQARGWLASRTVRANADGTPNSALDASTTIAYDATGNITRVTQPDGTYLQYGYDAAHRLTDVYDSATPSNYLLGDHIQYTLDAAGNRIDEKTSDPNGALKRELARTYDRLNRLTAVLNSANAAVRTFANAPDAPVGTTSVDGYDPNGNALYSFDGSTNRIATAQQYDPLNRLLKTLQDRAGSGATHDTQTLYAYDTRNNLRSVTDPDGLVTNYTYDALENLTDLSSPDTGHTAYGYDSAGNRQAQTDARGVATAYRYDALNRPTAIVYPTTSLNVTYVYDQPVTGCFNVGRLTQLIDSSGSTQYCYDRRGNVTSKTQNTTEQRSCATTETGCGSVSAKGLTLPPTNPMLTVSAALPVKYAYTLGDRVAAITYPSGAVVTYVRDAVGRVKSIVYQAQAGATRIAVLSGVTYYPFGPVNVLTFGNGRSLTKTYDADYANSSVASSASDGLAIATRVDRLGNITGAGATPGGSLMQQYLYDPLFRLTSVLDGTGMSLLDLSYDRSGDRTTKAWGTSAQKYFYADFTHRASSIGGVARTYDANGNLLTGGLSYDDRNRLSGWNLVGGQINPSGYSAAYGYNARGERTSKQTMQYYPLCTSSCTLLPGGLTGWVTGTEAFVYDESGQLLGEYPGLYGPGTATDYIWLDGIPVAIVRAGIVYYIETDALGTPRQIVKPGATSAGDTTVWKWDYFASNSAFGENAPSAQTIVFNLRFPGQYFDAETGLNYNYFRDYEPPTGRYVESDPIGLHGGISTYAYVASNPLRSSDVLGLAGCGSSWNERLVPDNPFRFKFSACCDSHDECYDCAGVEAGMSKKQCDTKFRNCMIRKCQHYSAPIRFVCQRTAATYYQVVNNFGGSSYDKGTKNCMTCTGRPIPFAEDRPPWIPSDMDW